MTHDAMTQPPNIIFIMTDQQRYDTIGALGYPFASTPVLDRLVQDGTSFEQCHVASPSCCPSRAALFKAMYPHSSGVMKNGDPWQNGWVGNLTEAGYHTVNIGKMHTEPMGAPAGFSERHTIENKERALDLPGVHRGFLDEWDKGLAANGIDRPAFGFYRDDPEFDQKLGAFDWPLAPGMHPDIFTGDLALWWMKRKPIEKPLFLQIGFPGPHPPYDPLPGMADKYLERDLNIRPFTKEEFDGQLSLTHAMSDLHQSRCPDSTAHRPFADMEDRKRQRACYHANQEMIDGKIGEILDTLDALGYLDNAIVVYTSDHGDCLGDHGLSQKWSFYDQITRVPLIVWSKNKALVPNGKSVPGLVQQHDIAQWLLEMAGIEVPEFFETESIAAAFGEEDFAGREAVFCEHGRDRYFHCDLGTMIRTHDWKCCIYPSEGVGQLFDLKGDPHEEHNLWDSDAHSEIKASLVGQIYNWTTESLYKTKDWAVEVR